MTDFEKKYYEAQQVLKIWVDKQGHDRCGYYPDIFRTLATILDVQPTKEPALPPLAEFKKGCEQYQQEEYLTHFSSSLLSHEK